MTWTPPPQDPDGWSQAPGGQAYAPHHYPQYPPSPQYPPPPGYGPRTYNGMAITSMILGILWLYWIGSILALIFGYVAKSQIRERNQMGSGMATAGIVLGWVGVGTLLLVIAFVVIGAATGGFDSPPQVVRLVR